MKLVMQPFRYCYWFKSTWCLKLGLKMTRIVKSPSCAVLHLGEELCCKRFTDVFQC